MVIVAIGLVAATSSARAQQDAGTLYARGDLDAAAAADQAVLAAKPADHTAQLNLGAIRLYENDLTAAEPLLRAAAAAQPFDPRATRLLTELHRRQDEAKRRTTLEGAQTFVAFETADPLPVVRIVANGKAADFVIDTGADVVLSPAFAKSIGVKTSYGGSGVFAGGQRATLQSGMLKSLALAGATEYDVPVHVLPMRIAALFPGRTIEGIVGTTYFERFLVTIDYPQDRLILRPRTATVSKAFQNVLPANAANVPFYLLSDHFVVARAAVNDAPAGPFLFDSGLAGGGLMPSADLVKAAGITIDQSRAFTGTGGAGAVTAIPFVAKRIAVGSAVQHDIRGLYTPSGGPFAIFPFTVWGIISNDFLRHYAYTVDFDAMKLALVPPPFDSAQGDKGRVSQQDVFNAAFRRLQSYPVPAYAVWTDTWHTRSRPVGYYTSENTSVNVARYAVRLSDGMENVSVPMPSGKLPLAIIEPEFMGPFAFTFRSSVHIAPSSNDGVVMQPDLAGLKTIATVTAVAQPAYTIAGAGESAQIEDVDGHKTYHLRLDPRSDPEKHNLRDLWVDVDTFDVWKAHFTGRYRPTPKAPVSPTEVTLYFKNVLNSWVVSRMVWNYLDPPTSFDFDVTTDEIALPATLPDWIFDASAYRQHQLAGETDYLGELLGRMRSGASPAPAATQDRR